MAKSGSWVIVSYDDTGAVSGVVYAYRHDIPDDAIPEVADAIAVPATADNATALMDTYTEPQLRAMTRAKVRNAKEGKPLDDPRPVNDKDPKPKGPPAHP